jgi:hypothetical protein
VSTDPERGDKPDPSESGSVEVQISGTQLPQAEAAPEPVSASESAPISSGRVHAVASEEARSGPTRSKRLSAAVSGGVEAIGTGIETLGEGVTRIGDATKRVPLVGASVGKLGEGLTKAGESIHALPRVAKTRRGRLLVRSVIVGFVLVAAWISVIVALELRGTVVPDFRPTAEHILVEISRGSTSIGEVYEKASPRFQEMVRKERFLDDMTDLDATVGKFIEITAINDTLVTTGPTGRIGRVSLTASYARGICKGSISFHWDQGQWKLLGIGLELPPELKITQAQREQRVAACHDPDNRKTCDVRDAAETILEELRDGKAGEVWDAAGDIFREQETRAKFAAIQDEHREVLGAYKRILNVTEAKVIGGTSATFDVVVEFDRSSGVRVVFGFERDTKAAPWRLRSFKLVVPMPRADEGSARPEPAPAR